MPTPSDSGTAGLEALLYASPLHSGDMRYFARVDVPDPFLAFEHDAKRVAVLNQLEIDRVREADVFDEILPWEGLRERALKKRTAQAVHPAAEVLALLVKDLGIPGFRVPFDFPAGLVSDLRKRRIKVAIAPGSLFPERQYKQPEEREAIRRANRIASAGFEVVEELLAEASVDGSGQLVHGGELLTSERVRRAIHGVALDAGATTAETIVAGGDQACDPHQRGFGPLRAGELIIVDIFPRLDDSGYFGDMTRTYLKGRARQEQRQLVQTVQAAKEMALPMHVAGAAAPAIYREVIEFFTAEGFATETRDGRHVGFFHGLGHGLGLDIHEAPRIGPGGDPLEAGHVVTLEPGLYYPGLGGCRFEDVLHVTGGAPELLSTHTEEWEIA